MRRFSSRSSILVVLVALGCSSSSSSDAPADTGVGPADVATDAKLDDASDAGVGCGSPPYVTYTAQVQVFTSTGINPGPGAKLTSPLCPGMTFTSGADGKIVVRVQRDTPVTGEVLLAGAIPASLAEAKLDADWTAPGISLYSTDFNSVAPDLATKGYINPQVDTKGAAGECAKDGGIVYSVPEDPSAVVTYLDATGKKLTGATMTIDGGSALIAVTPSDTLVHLTATKTGCTYAPSYPLTGRIKVIKGDLTVFNQTAK